MHSPSSHTNLDHGALEPLISALNDVEATLIGDPRSQTGDHVGIRIATVGEATPLWRLLAAIGVHFSTNISHEESGDPARYWIAVRNEQIDVLNREVGDLLDEERQRSLDELARIRGPVPQEYVERILYWDVRRERPGQIAERMNDAGVIDGMRGKSWSPARVSALIKADRESRAQRDNNQGGT